MAKSIESAQMLEVRENKWKRQRICVFSCSNGVGVGDSIEHGGWVSRLEKLAYRDLGDIFEIYNLSVRGDDTYDFLYRAEGEFIRRKGTVAILELGLNDAQFLRDVGRLKVPPQSFETNCRKLIRKFRELASILIVIGPSPVNESFTSPCPWDPSRDYFKNDVVHYSNVLKGLCETEGITFLDLFEIISLDDLVDGIHPSPSGHAKVAATVYKTINAQL